VSRSLGIEIVDVTDGSGFARLPPCADARFDHRSCDYWEDEVGGSKASRSSWWRPTERSAAPVSPALHDNPFAPSPRSTPDDNPFASPSTDSPDLTFNPFAPRPKDRPQHSQDLPRKLRLLLRGETVFGAYAKVLVEDAVPAVYAQFGPLSAYPRAQQIRDLYPRLPQSPLPAVITCIASTAAARRRGLARRLVDAIRHDLARRGFAAIETYPDLTLAPDAASAAHPRFWERCGFVLAIDDERYPVMRIELD
jgi:ribosomal protein S18 acetylase RimI-like enzyme